MIALDTGALGVERRSVRQTMTLVMVALLPGTTLYAVLIDYRILANLVIACLFALCCEALCLHLRKRAILPALGDGSIVLASWLLVLCLPPSLPTWQLLIGVATLALLGKHLFGGLGHNPFNPAMVAYAVLLVSFPVTMTDWDLAHHRLLVLQTDSNISDDRSSVVIGDMQNGAEGTATFPDDEDAASSASASASASAEYANFQASQQELASWDGISGATVLDRLRDLKQLSSSELLTTHTKPPLDAGNSVLGTPWVWVSLGWLVGGLYLLWQRIISWHIPGSILFTVATLYMSASFWAISVALPTIPALLSGGIMLGAFFIATDPVSAAASRQGQILYGVGIGVFTFFIREYSVYPEGFAFAVLLMNLCVPLIDRISTGKGGRMTLSDTR